MTYYGTETKPYVSGYRLFYGYYELQPGDVNGRPYFKRGYFGLWWNGINQWWIGKNIYKGQSIGLAKYTKDVFCPHQLKSDWRLWYGTSWKDANKDLVLSSEYNLKAYPLKNLHFCWIFRLFAEV